MVSVRIDYHFDTICPWCFIGKRRLDRALAQRPDVAAEIRWLPFMLNPDLPPDGLPRQAYLERKFGGSHRLERILSALVQAGESEDIAFDFARIERTPSTLASHRMISFAQPWGLQDRVVEAVFAAYFLGGRDIGDTRVLLEIAEGMGLPTDRLASYLAQGSGVDFVNRESARAGSLGINGVPAIVIDHTFALAGAQEPEILVRLIDLASQARSSTTLTPMSFS